MRGQQIAREELGDERACPGSCSNDKVIHFDCSSVASLGVFDFDTVDITVVLEAQSGRARVKEHLNTGFARFVHQMLRQLTGMYLCGRAGSSHVGC